MADAFLGTWEGTATCGDITGFEKFCKALETKEELIKEFSKVTMGTKYESANGKLVMSLLVNGEVKKTTEIELGKEFVTKGLDGKDYKCVITINGEKAEETAVPTDGTHKGTKTLRSIQGGVMTVKTCKTDDAGANMTYTMNKK